jgi:integrase
MITFKECATACYNMHWAGSKNEDECIRLMEWWTTKYTKFPNAISVSNAIGESRNEGRANGTINRRLACLSKILHVAKDLGAIAEVPKIPRLPEEKTMERVVDKAEEERFLDAAHELRQPEFAVFLTLLIDSGLRVGEALALRWSDLGGIWDRITVARSKSGRPRTVPCTSRLSAALSCHKDETHAPVLFAHLWTKSQLNHLWDKVRSKAGIEDVRLHDFRHTFASRLVRQGTDIYTVMHLLGHKSVVTTMRYAHLNTDVYKDAISTLDES